MRTRATVVSLVVLAVFLWAAAPGFAQQPAPKSYFVTDAVGIIIDCWDFNNNHSFYSWGSDKTGSFDSMDISADTGTPADSMFYGQIRNLDFWEEGSPVTRLQFTGTCEAQGGSYWGFAPSWGNASCGMATFMRNIGGFGNFNASNALIQVGPLWDTCTRFYSAPTGPSKRLSSRAGK